MIAIDTSSLIAYFRGDSGDDTQAVDEAFMAGVAVIIPAVLSEILTDLKLPKLIESELRRLPILEITDGYWQRVGKMRRIVLIQKRKARLAAALITQSCLDYRVPLICRYFDFRRFAAVAPLKLIPVLGK